MMKSMSVSAVLKFTSGMSLLRNEVTYGVKFSSFTRNLQNTVEDRNLNKNNYWSLKIKIKQLVDKLLHLLGIFLSTTQEHLI